MQRGIWGALVACLSGSIVFAQTQPNASALGRVRKPKPAEAQQVGERGPHWQTVTNLVPVPDDADGWQYQTNTYVHLETGLNYRDAQGQWVETREEFELLPQGAVARQGQHQVTLPSNLNGNQPVQLVQPDGQVVTSRPHGLAYFDSATGQAVLLAELKDCQGFQIAPNQILYTDAFDDIQADVRYTYTKGGFEQDIVLKQAPPAPEKFGLNSATTRLEVWSEFLGAPTPTRQVSVLKPGPVVAGRDESFTDDQLDFGAMKMGGGRAFQAGARDESSVPVGKSWIQDQGRTFLIEAVELPAVAPDLQVLPQTPGGASLKHKPGKRETAFRQLKAPSKAAKSEQAAIRPATKELLTALIGPALVLDYTTLNAGTLSANYVFKGDTTYYISGAVFTTQSTTAATTFEGGAVIKYANTNSASLTVNTPIVWQGSLYRPVVLTAKDDNTVGEAMSGSTGSPSGTYATTALYLDGSATGANNGFALAHLRIAYAQTAVLALNSQTTNSIRHLQLVNCGTGIIANGAGIYVGNALFYNVTTCLSGTSPGACVVEQATVDAASTFSGSGFTTINPVVRNCLFYAVTTPGNYYNGGGNQTASTNPFRVLKGGLHYLDSNTYRNVGSTSINAGLAAELTNLTTYAPRYLTNAITTNTTLFPQAVRDTDVPDVGYHYPPIDYVWSNLTNNANVTLVLTNGVAVGMYGQVGVTAIGPFYSTGLPNALNRLTLLNTVQEQLAGIVTNTGTFSLRRSSGSYLTQFRFTDMSFMAAATGGREFSAYVNNIGDVNLTDCQLRGVYWYYIGDSYQYLHTFTLTNCLAERSTISWGQGYSTYPNNLAITLQNVLFSRATISLTHAGTTYGAWKIYDNLFDNSTVTVSEMNPYPYGSVLTTLGYNGFINTTAIGSTGNKTGLNRDFQTGPLGAYYYPNSGTAPSLASLLDADTTRTPASLGLYHHTTRADRTKDSATSASLDIGYHYVATDSNGVPVDTDGDGVPDYQEDLNGDGLTGSTETDALAADSDGDGMDDGQERVSRRDPLNAGDATDAVMTQWRFSRGLYSSEQGDQPLGGFKALLDPTTWDGNAVRVDYISSGSPYTYGWLGYPWKDAAGRKLLNPVRGTVQLWFRPNWTSSTAGSTTSADGVITTSRKLVTVQAVNDTSEFWSLELNAAGNLLTLTVKRQDEASPRVIVQQAVSLSAKKWCQLAVAYDGTGASLWKDGVQLGTAGTFATGKWPVAILGAAVKNLWVGGWNNSATCTANGMFDDITIYNRKLTAAEIQKGYQQVAELDTDGDGLSDLLELSLTNFSAGNRDTDGDGLPDGWEYKYWGDNSSHTATEDTDGDGSNNLTEYVNGTNPTVVEPVWTTSGIPQWQLAPDEPKLINVDFARTSSPNRVLTDSTYPDTAGKVQFSTGVTTINPVIASAVPANDWWNTVSPGVAGIRLVDSKGARDQIHYVLSSRYGPVVKVIKGPTGGSGNDCYPSLTTLPVLDPTFPKPEKPPGYKSRPMNPGTDGATAGGRISISQTCIGLAVRAPSQPVDDGTLHTLPFTPPPLGTANPSFEVLHFWNCRPVFEPPCSGALGSLGPISYRSYSEGSTPYGSMSSWAVWATLTQYFEGLPQPYAFSSATVTANPSSVIKHPMYQDYAIGDEETINALRATEGWDAYSASTTLNLAEMLPGYWRVIVYSGTENARRDASVGIGGKTYRLLPGNPYEDHFIESRHYVQGLVQVGLDGLFTIDLPKPAVVNGMQLLLLEPLPAPAWNSTPLQVLPTVGVVARWNQVPGALSYRICRAEASTGPWVDLVSGLKATWYRDASVTLGPGNTAKTYWYKIVAENEVDEYRSESGVNSIVVPTTLNIANRPPVLNYVNPLGTAWNGRPYSIGSDELRRKAVAVDFEGQPLSFQIVELKAGILMVNGVEVTDAMLKSNLQITTPAHDSMLYSIGAKSDVKWIPGYRDAAGAIQLFDQTGIVNAFRVKAFDGIAFSDQTADVPVEVKPPVEVLWAGSTFRNLSGNGKRVDSRLEYKRDWTIRYFGPTMPQWWGVLPSPVVFAGGGHLEDVVQLAAGYGGSAGGFTLALKSDGTLWSWGNGGACLGDGQVNRTTPDNGLPWFTDQPAVSPQQITLAATSVAAPGVLPPIRQVSSRAGHSVAVSQDGHVYVWGTRNYHGYGWLSDIPENNLCEQQLAAPPVQAVPWQYDPTDPEDVRNARSWVMTGTPTPTLLVGLEQVSMVACSAGGAVVLKESGEIMDWGTVCWFDGSSAGYRWDYNSSTLKGMTPVPDMDWPQVKSRQALNGSTVERIVEVAAGDQAFLALSDTGRVYAWGAYDSLAFADPLLTTGGTAVPRKVPGLPANVIHITACGAYYLALTAEGTVFEWGTLGNGTIARVHAVHGLPAATKIFTTGDRAYAVAQDGRLWGWGLNGSKGQVYAGLLLSNDQRQFISDPELLPDLSNVVSISSPDLQVVHYATEKLAEAPRNLKAVAGNARISLTWSAYPLAKGYQISASDTANGTYTVKAVVTATADSTQSWTDLGLENGKLYYYTVAALVNNTVTGPSPYAWASPVPPPSPVTGLTFAPLSREARVSWTPCLPLPLEAGRYLVWRAGPYATGASIPDSAYQLYYTLDSGSLRPDTGGKLYLNDTGLESGKYYWYKVAAENSSGIGTAATVSGAVTPPSVVPAAPDQGSVGSGDGYGLLNFTYSASNDSGPRTEPTWVFRIYEYPRALATGVCGVPPTQAEPDRDDTQWRLIEQRVVDAGSTVSGSGRVSWDYDSTDSDHGKLYLKNLDNFVWYKVEVSARDGRGSNARADDVVYVFQPTVTDTDITLLEKRSGPGYIYLRYRSKLDFYFTQVTGTSHATCSTDSGYGFSSSACFAFTEWPWTDGSDTESWMLNLPETPAGQYYAVNVTPGGAVTGGIAENFAVSYRSPSSTPLGVGVKKADQRIKLQWDDAANYSGWRFMAERLSASASTPVSSRPSDCDQYTQWTFLKQGQERTLVDAGLANDQVYKYRIIAIDPNDTSPDRFVWEVTDWIQPGATATVPGPNALQATSYNSAVALSWGPVTPLQPNVTHWRYDLHHRETGSRSDEILYSVEYDRSMPSPPPEPATYTFQHQPLLNGTSHTYWLEVTFDNEDVLVGSEVLGLPLGTLAPLLPANVSLRLIGSTVYLNWDPVPTARAYMVYWKPSGGSCTSAIVSRCYYVYSGYAAGTTFNVVAIGANGAASSTAPCTGMISPGAAVTIPDGFNNLPSDRTEMEVSKIALMLPGLTGSPASVVTPTNVTLQASVAISAATVSKVQFYDNSSLIGQIAGKNGDALQPPYIFEWVNPPAGSHSLVALATTDKGQLGSTPVALNVSLRPPLSEFTTSETDFELKGPGSSFPLTRVYRSDDVASGILGIGWKYSFERASLDLAGTPGDTALSQGWEMPLTARKQTDLGFLFPVIQESASARHEINVTLPSGATLKFVPAVELSAGYSTSMIAYSDLLDEEGSLVVGTMRYYATDGSGAQLEVTDSAMSGNVNVVVLKSDADNDGTRATFRITNPAAVEYNPLSFAVTLPDGSRFEYFKVSPTATSMRLSRIVDADGNAFRFETWGGTDSGTLYNYTFTDSGTKRIKIIADAAKYISGTGLTTTTARQLWLDRDTATSTWTVYDPVVTTATLASGTPNVPNGPGVRKLVYSGSYLTQVKQLIDRAQPSNYRVQQYVNSSQPNPAVGGFTSRTVLEQVINPDGIVLLKNTYGVNNGFLVLTSQTDSTGIHRDLAYPGSTGGDLTSAVKTAANATLATETVNYSDRGEIGQISSATDANTPAVVTQNAYDDQGRLAFTGTQSGSAFVNTTAITYDSKDRPTDVTDATGATTHYEYTADSKPLSVTNPNQNVTSSLYQENPYTGNGTLTKLRTQVDAANNFTDYDYNDRGQVARETRHLATGDSLFTCYEYYNDNTSSAGRIGDLKRVYQPLAAVWTGSGDPAYPALLPLYATEYTYDSNGNRLTETSLRNTRVVVSGAEVTKLERITTTYTVDPLGRSVATARSRDWVTVSGSTYVTESGSALILETSSTVFDNSGRQASSTDPNSRKTSSLYDVRGNLIQTTYPDGTVTRTVYDTLGRPIVTQERATPSVAASGNVPPLGTTTAAASQTDYDAAGRVIFTHRLTGTVITVAADTSYLGYVAGNPAQYNATVTTAGTDWSKTRTVYNSAGQVQYQVNPLGTLTENVYDTAGHRIEVRSYYNDTFPLDSTAIVTSGKPYYRTTYGYDPAGNNIWVRDANANQAGSTAQATLTEIAYDSLNRPTVTTFPAVPTATGTRATRSTVYDSLGQRVQEVDEDKVSTVFRYDVLGRLTAVINDWKAGVLDTAQTYRTTYEYDEVGNQIAQVDAEGRRTRYEYDALGRRVARVLPGGSLVTANTVEKTAYTLVGSNPSLLKRDVTDFAGRTRTYSYDIADRLQSLLLPATGSTAPTTSRLLVWEYSVAGRVGRVREYDGGTTGGTILRTQQYVYDDAGRLALKIVPEGTLTMTYDAAGNQTGLTARKTYTLGATGAGVTLSQATLTTSTDPTGADLVYGYNVLGRFATVKTDAETVADATYGYDPNGNLQTLTYQNGVTTTYTYNARNQLRLAKALKSATLVGEFDYDGAETSPPWSSTIFTVDRTLSATGLRRQLAERIGTAAYAVYQYDYDTLHRLVKEHRGAATTDNPLVRYDAWTDSVPSPAVVNAGYDKVGNRRNRSVQTGTASPTAWQQFDYDAKDRISGSRSLGHTTTTASAFTYDANGNMLTADLDANGTADNATADVYDAQNRLVQAVRGTKTITLGYDPDGNRVSKAVTVGSTTTTTLYLVADTNPSGYAQVLEERPAATGAPTVRYTYGLGLVGQRWSAATSTRYYGRDGLGSVRYLTDTTGAVTDTYYYDAFGLLQSSTGAAVNSYRYAGEQWDADLGLYYNRARYYSPELGRFWTMDSYEGSQQDPLSLHKYLYCHGDGVNYSDPGGHAEGLAGLAMSMAIRAGLSTLTGAAIGGLANGLDAAIDKNPDRNFLDGFETGVISGAKFGFWWTFKIPRILISIYGAAVGGYSVGEAIGDDQPYLAAYRGALLGASIYFGSSSEPKLKNNTEIGDLGEARAMKWLEKNNYTDIITIKNGSGNGIDIVARTPDGRLAFFEVKSSSVGKIKGLSDRQQNMSEFVLEILRQAAKGEGRYKNTSASQQATARALLREFNADPAKVSGTVVGIDLKNGQMHVSPWEGRPEGP